MGNGNNLYLESLCLLTFFLLMIQRVLFCFLFSYSSGGEDGYVRVQVFDPSYFEVEFEY